MIEQLAVMVAFEIEHAEIERADRQRPQGASPHDLYLRAQSLLRTSRSDDNAAAFALISAALEIEPENAAFLATACEILGGQRIPMGWEPLTSDDRELCRVYAHRGLALNAVDAGQLALFGMGVFRTDDPDLGYWTARRATELNPNSIMALVCAGNIALNWGTADETRQYLHRALALNPLDPRQRFSYAALSSIESREGRLEDALELAQRAYAINQSYAAIHWHLVALNTNLNRLDLGRRLLKRLMTLHPGTTLQRIAAGQPSRNNNVANMLDGLARAGLS